MTFSPDKQFFFSPSPFTDCSSLIDLNIRPCDGMVIVGGPIGPPDFVHDFLIKILAKYSAAIDFLAPLIFDFPQEALCLFTFCIVPSINHVLRCVPLGPLHDFTLKIRERDKAFILHLL